MSIRLIILVGLGISLVGSIVLGMVALQTPPFVMDMPKTYAGFDAYYAQADRALHTRNLVILAVTMSGFALQIFGLLKFKSGAINA